MILGASECSKIKTATKPQAGQPSEPIAELTHLRWTMRPQGRKSLAPMSFFFPISFFSQVRVQDSATGNIVTQYYLPHGRVVGVYTSSPTSSMLLRRVACHPAGRKTKPVKGKMSFLRANGQHASGIVEH